MELICKGITKSFGHNRVLTDIGLSVKEGEIRALLGGNGSGKSTLVKILAGTVKESAGSIELFGRAYTVSGPSEAKAKGVVMTSQELSLLGNLSVAENISLCVIPRKGPFTAKKEIEKKAREVLGELDMLRICDKKVDDLAPNEKYMVEYAKAIVQQPKVLLVDEITSALFKENVETIKRSLLELKAKGCMIIFISHRMQEIYDICDTVTILRNGQQVADLEVAGAEERVLLSYMTGKEIGEESVSGGQIAAFSEDGEKVFSVRGLKLKSFGSRIDIEAQKGEIIGVVGLQGHGQSEFIRTLFGLGEPVECQLGGKCCLIKNPVSAIKSGISFISGDRETDGVFREQSISENLNSIRQLLFNDNARNDAELLEKYKVVYADQHQKLTELSGGNQQKVIIGRWLSVAPKLLLADDPTKGVDVNARTDVHKMMSELADSGSVVIMFTSDNDELVNIAHNAKKVTVLVMYEGEIVSVLRGEDITEENISKASLQGKRA